VFAFGRRRKHTSQPALIGAGVGEIGIVLRQMIYARADSRSVEGADLREIEDADNPKDREDSGEPGWPSGHQILNAGSTQISLVRPTCRIRLLTIEFGRRLANMLSARHVGHPIAGLRGQRTHLTGTDVVADRL
jgi:hypothetical protein